MMNPCPYGNLILNRDSEKSQMGHPFPALATFGQDRHLHRLKIKKMTLTEVLTWVDDAFQPSPRPELTEFTLHQKDCGDCEYLQERLAVYNGADFTPTALHVLFGAFSTLSPSATLWLLSTHLRQLLLDPVEMDLATERLIYRLSPSAEFEADTRQQLSLLNEKQIACLMAVVDYWLICTELGEQYPEELDCAKAFLQRLHGSPRTSEFRAVEPNI